MRRLSPFQRFILALGTLGLLVAAAAVLASWSAG